MREADTLSMINIIAAKHGMTVEIDFNGKSINFIGNYNKAAGIACVKEIAKVFGE